ncbi:hypothetical protein PCL_03898 [Purpureocillium lilacinum]|uniref:Uncharacterized protein n=1 Tax=Purpureocillium lilacinum TaxID=33203 RepID=A0A2U3EQB7_PURLI|nr:hypothetical protein PCL_03898 [Purpureocillium lilacinum]
MVHTAQQGNALASPRVRTVVPPVTTSCMHKSAPAALRLEAECLASSLGGARARGVFGLATTTARRMVVRVQHWVSPPTHIQHGITGRGMARQVPTVASMASTPSLTLIAIGRSVSPPSSRARTNTVNP